MNEKQELPLLANQQAPFGRRSKTRVACLMKQRFFSCCSKTRLRGLFRTTSGFRLLLYRNTQSLRVRSSNHRESQYSRYPPSHANSKSVFNL